MAPLSLPATSTDQLPHFETGSTGHTGFYVNGTLCAGWTRSLTDAEQYEVRLLYRGHHDLSPSSRDLAVPTLREGLVGYWRFNAK